MAHFAELDENNIVKRVVVVGNDITTTDGLLGDNDMHIDGETWCIKFFKGGIWKQTSYNNNFRKQYAGVNYIYNSEKNIFICPQPYSSWSLNSNDDWQAPIIYPTVTNDGETPIIWSYLISWDETKYNADNTKGWEARKSNDISETPTKYDWNGTDWISS